MNTQYRTSLIAVGLASIIGLGGCSGMSGRDKDTALGAGAGAVAGAVLSGGVLGTAAGAAGGAVLGHVLSGEDDKKKSKKN